MTAGFPVGVSETMIGQHRFADGFAFAGKQWLADGAGLGRMVRKHGRAALVNAMIIPFAAAALGLVRGSRQALRPWPYFAGFAVGNYIGLWRGLTDRSVPARGPAASCSWRARWHGCSRSRRPWWPHRALVWLLLSPLTPPTTGHLLLVTLATLAVAIPLEVGKGAGTGRFPSIARYLAPFAAWAMLLALVLSAAQARQGGRAMTRHGRCRRRQAKGVRIRCQQVTTKGAASHGHRICNQARGHAAARQVPSLATGARRVLAAIASRRPPERLRWPRRHQRNTAPPQIATTAGREAPERGRHADGGRVSPRQQGHVERGSYYKRAVGGLRQRPAAPRPADMNCTAAAGTPSTNTTYQVAAGDVGHMLVFLVTAFSSPGSSTPASSAPSGAVAFGAPLDTAGRR